MSVEGTYRNHAARLRELVMEALRAEEGYAEVRRRIRRYLSGEEVGADLAEELAEEAEQQFRWIDRRRMDPEDRRRAAEVLEGASAGFARMEGATGERLKKVVVRAIQDDATLGEIENRVARALSSGWHQAYTVANTARAGTFRSAEQIREGSPDGEEEEAEQLHFKFVGPPPERAFCKKHIGRVYTEAEIQRLSNGQGLPVRYYMGGYNCRHRWVLASDEEAERRMTDADLRPRAAASPDVEAGGSGDGSSGSRSAAVGSGGTGAAGGGGRAGSRRGGGRDSGGGDDLPAGRRRFEELTTSDEYFDAEEHGYYSEEQDGFVAVRKGHQLHNIDGEMRTARIFADRGVHVELLDETGQGPSADARHGGPRGDGLDWDYKEAQAGGNPKTQVSNALRRGKRPSGNVLVRFQSENVDVDLLNRGVKGTMLQDRQRDGQPLIERFVVFYPTPTGFFEESRTPEEFLDEQKVFRGP